MNLRSCEVHASCVSFCLSWYGVVFLSEIEYRVIYTSRCVYVWDWMPENKAMCMLFITVRLATRGGLS